ncbi:MAG: hypothetical protein K5842_05585, partial [Bacteroidales bacterium]|nr:hypothetical protein [Bacteroidales bacterium]
METKKHPSSQPAGTGQGRTNTARQSRWLLLIAILLMAMPTAWAQDTPAISVFTEIPTIDGGENSNWNFYNESPSKLVDGNTSTKYGLSSNDPWVEFHYSSPFTPHGYILWTANDELGKRNPRSWTIKGKKSGDADWTTIAEVDNSNGDKLPMANNTPTTFYMSNSVAYQYYRFEATRASNGEFQLAELQFFELTGGPNDLQYATITGITSEYVYTGSVIPLVYTVTAYDGTVLTKGTDYTESITKDGLPSAVKERGDYVLTITGKGSYSGSKTFTFNVNSYQADYERALSAIKDNTYYRIFTEIDGQRYYLNKWGILTTSVSDSYRFRFQKVGGGAYEYGFLVFNEDDSHVFTNNSNFENSFSFYFSSYQGADSQLSCSQVFFLNEEGRYAVRSTNVAHGEEGINLWGSAFWAIKLDGEGKVCSGYSYEKNYIWQLEEDDIYAHALETIENQRYYRVYTEVDGQKYYVDANGSLTDNETEAPSFKFLKVAGEEYANGFMLQNGNTYFTRPDGTTDAALTQGHLNTTSSTASNTWDAQVFLLGWKGLYAIRSTNAASGTSGENLYGNTFWTVNTTDDGPVAEYSFDRNFVWQIELDPYSSHLTEYTNIYPVGTTFPKFQFKLENMTGVTVVDDAVTVTYTHVNGTTWTETYKLSSLKAHQGDGAGVMLYDLPFSFTEEHPDANKDQVGKTLVTAQIAMNIRNGSGQTEAVSATVTLVPQWREISFGGYSEVESYHFDLYYGNDGNIPINFTGEVMYLPRDNYSIGYRIYYPDENGNPVYLGGNSAY